MTNQQPPSVNDLLAGGGAPALAFPTIGTTHKGTILRSETSQQTDFDTGAPLYWDDGNPRWQIVITLATDQRDHSIDDDDGERRLFVNKGNMLAKFKEALRAIGATGIDPGDTIAVQYSGDGQVRRAGMHPPKQFTVQIEKGAGPLSSTTDGGVTPPQIADLL